MIQTVAIRGRTVARRKARIRRVRMRFTGLFRRVRARIGAGWTVEAARLPKPRERALSSSFD